ncbi:hypothetical protein K402DRAFT_450284 [Aulographum hederae CBS 113979]|uniref:Uncharacterized protein n=1 Tax=Aulographum hederae CBS 113979 TaxID=1176131 RepID=A0A6G1HDL3_9PEZI|nr:hypothetical protein K402DRAFT_450284 [Aulographum hederae CBS 113979]
MQTFTITTKTEDHGPYLIPAAEMPWEMACEHIIATGTCQTCYGRYETEPAHLPFDGCRWGIVLLRHRAAYYHLLLAIIEHGFDGIPTEEAQIEYLMRSGALDDDENIKQAAMLLTGDQTGYANTIIPDTPAMNRVMERGPVLIPPRAPSLPAGRGPKGYYDGGGYREEGGAREAGEYREAATQTREAPTPGQRAGAAAEERNERAAGGRGDQEPPGRPDARIRTWEMLDYEFREDSGAWRLKPSYRRGV